MNYIYYFFNFKNEIIYIGKTKDLKQRMNTHFFKGHLPKECYQEVFKVMAAEAGNSKTDTEIYETILINKYKPKYNKDKKYNQNSNNTSYSLPHLRFRELYLTFYNDDLDVSFTNKDNLCYSKKFTHREKCKYIIDFNLGILKHKTSYIQSLCENITKDNEWIIDKLLILNQNIFKYINYDYCDTDEPISQSTEYLTDGYVAFDIKLLENCDFSLEEILSIIHTGFIFRINQNTYATPLYSINSLSAINFSYKFKKSIFE